MAKQKRLGELLLEAGLINENQLRGALERQKKWGGRFGANLVLNGAISEEKLMRFFASRTGVREMDISRVQILPHIIKKLPLKIAEKYHMMPLAMKDKNTLILACSDPSDLEALDQVSFVTGLKVEPVLSSHSAIQNAIDRYYLGNKGRPKEPAPPEPKPIDAGTPNLVRMESMEKHGGKESLEDPDLIIFGNQSEGASPPEPMAFSPQVSPSPPVEPASPYSYLDETDEDEFNLDFDTVSNHPQPAPRPGYSVNQKLQALYSVLIKKGLVTEAEIFHEIRQLKASGKLSAES